MGLDVYAYIMIGVPAKNYLSREEKYVEIQETNWDGELMFKRDGTPIMRTARKEWYAYKGKEYHNLYDIAEIDHDTKHKEENPIVLECFDGEYIGPQDTIGLIVCDNPNEGGDMTRTTLEELTELQAIAKTKLVEMGITEDPTIRLVMCWSC